MASTAAKIFVSFMAANDIEPSFVDDEEMIVRIGWKLNNTKISNYFIFGEDDQHVQIQGHEFLEVSEDKYEIMLKVINECNKEYRWVKFYLDEENGEVVVVSDAIIQLDSCAEELSELMQRLNHIVEEAYPIFMKAMWA